MKDLVDGGPSWKIGGFQEGGLTYFQPAGLGLARRLALRLCLEGGLFDGARLGEKIDGGHGLHLRRLDYILGHLGHDPGTKGAPDRHTSNCSRDLGAAASPSPVSAARLDKTLLYV